MASTTQDLVIDAGGPVRRPLRGLLVAQSLGAFNDNAWKQFVALLAIAAATSDQAAQGAAAMAQVALMVPLMLVSLPAGVLADRLSKRTVIVGMKCLELAVMVAGTAALYLHPSGGWPALAVLGLLGVQSALFSPAKYGILPEILPHGKLSRGNGLLELWSNLAIIGGTVAGGVFLAIAGGRPWLGGLALAALSAAGLVAALGVPRVPAARSEGGLASTVRIAWSAIRADRILRLALCGQVAVWTIASLIPAPVLAYSKRALGLADWQSGLPLAVLGLGIGAGSVLAGKLSGAKIEYGLLPLGGIGLTATTLAFAIMGPGLGATLALMAAIGVFSGLLFVPLNALIQWRSPGDRRGAVIALANTIVFAGMLAGSLLALGLAGAGIAARGTFLGASLALAAGSAWALWLVPEAFLRFILLVLASTLYRVTVIGRPNVPQDGPALLTPNHVSFADGLFLVASIDRPVRFVVHARFFRHPLLGPFLRGMRAIPISADGGPKQILRAFRDAGRALDEGHLVCIFPEGQVTRTGTLQPFQRGMQAILKGRGGVPIVPVHLDRATSSLFSPTYSPAMPRRTPLPVTVSFGAPLPAETPRHALQQAIHDLDQEAWAYRKPDRRPLHHEFIRRARRLPSRLALADPGRPRVPGLRALAGATALARALRQDWDGQPAVGILLPPGVPAALANLAASMAGRAAVNLDGAMEPEAMASACRRAGLRSVLLGQASLDREGFALPDGVAPILIEDVEARVGPGRRLAALALARLAPIRLLERAAGAGRRPSVDDPATILFPADRAAEGGGGPRGVVLSHINIDSNVQAVAQVLRIRPDDRILSVLPLSDAFGTMSLWLAANHGMGSVFPPAPPDPAAVGALVERDRVTILMAPPSFLGRCLRSTAPAQFGSLRLVISVAEPLAPGLVEAFEDRFGIRPREGYGMPECSAMVALSVPDYRAPGFFQPGSRRGSVGQPLPGVSTRVVHPETSEPLGPDQEGILLIKGPNVAQGSLGPDGPTAAPPRDGWFVSGDLGSVDEDGFLQVAGLRARLSRVDGELVSHCRVEQELHRALGLDPHAFAVTSVPDGPAGDRLAVLHTLDDARVRSALAGLSGAGLPGPYVPPFEAFLRVESLPTRETGALDLVALGRIARQSLAPPDDRPAPDPEPDPGDRPVPPEERTSSVP